MRRTLLVVLTIVATLPAARAEEIFGITGPGSSAGVNQLVRFDSSTPGTIASAVAITGLQTNERIVGIDFRPRTGQLFAVGVVPSSTDAIRLYTLNPVTGAATVVTTAPFVVTPGGRYGMDFNPTVDRIRVVNTGDENFRINPNNGARADTPTNDTDLNPVGQLVDAIAYDRNFDTGIAVANRTTLYGIRRTGNQLVLIGGLNQSPSPNGGGITAVGALGVTISSTAGAGFDISRTSGTAYGAWVDNADAQSRLYAVDLASGAATPLGAIGGGTVQLDGIAVRPPAKLWFGQETKLTRVRAFDLLEPQVELTIAAFPDGHKGGVRVAAGDVNRDGIADLVVGSGPGSPPLVRVFDGRTGSRITEFLAYDSSFLGGVFVAAGDVNGDGAAEVIVSPGPGIATEVRIFNGTTHAQLDSFQAFGLAIQGATVAACDLDLDGDAEIVVGSGPGMPPQVRVVDGNGVEKTTFAPYPDTFSSAGVHVAAGRRSALPFIATSLGKGSAQVKLFASPTTSGMAFTEDRAFTAFPGRNPGGARVALLDVDLDGVDDVVVAPGPGRRNAKCAVFNGATGALLRTLIPFAGNGAFVAAAR